MTGAQIPLLWSIFVWEIHVEMLCKQRRIYWDVFDDHKQR